MTVICRVAPTLIYIFRRFVTEMFPPPTNTRLARNRLLTCLCPSAASGPLRTRPSRCQTAAACRPTRLAPNPHHLLAGRQK